MNLIYDLHITVNPDRFDKAFVESRWKIHDIRNVQGIQHLIISQKYIGPFPLDELKKMADKLQENSALVLREKIELHFDDYITLESETNADKVIEIHYKLKKRGVFGVTGEQISELNKIGIALSFNMSTARRIISVRFKNRNAYLNFRADGRLPSCLEEEERELVIFDTNNGMDSFWPIRTMEDEKFSFDLFPQWATL